MLIQINCNQFRNSARRTSYDLYARSAKPKVQANPGAALPELQLFVPPDVSLSSLSVAEAARQALSAIDPAGHSDK
jgi:hypothetical protein